MPTLSLKLTPPVDDARAASLAQALTAVTADTLGKRAGVTAVLIEPLAVAHWHVNGRPVMRPTARLQIDVTAGTNSEAQKARFIEAAFKELQQQLAPGAALEPASYVIVHEPASYVIVHELAAQDWGYGGITQAARQAQRKANVVSESPV